MWKIKGGERREFYTNFLKIFLLKKLRKKVEKKKQMTNRGKNKIFYFDHTSDVIEEAIFDLYDKFKSFLRALFSMIEKRRRVIRS